MHPTVMSLLGRSLKEVDIEPLVSLDGRRPLGEGQGGEKGGTGRGRDEGRGREERREEQGGEEMRGGGARREGRNREGKR